MRVLRSVLFCFAMLACGAAAMANPPTFNGNVNGSLTVPQAGSLIVATPAPNSGASVYSAGDSITFGLGINNQSTNGCSFYTYPSPCYVDQMDSYWGATKQDVGTSFSCLESTTTTGSLCNTTSGYTPLINSWTTSLKPYAGNNSNWFTIMIGTNDVACAISQCNSATAPDSQINVATFKSDLETIVGGLIGQGTPPAQIILGEIPWQNMISYGTVSNSNNSKNTLGGTALQMSFNFAIAQVAIEYHTRLALTYQAMGMCIPAAFPSQNNPCMTDSAHPNNTGHANLAKAFEQATILNAYTALAAYQANGMLNTAVVVTNPYNYTFQTSALQLTANTGGRFGNVGSYWNTNVGNGNASGYGTWGTTSSSVNGVPGDCGFFQSNAPTNLVDMTINCSTGNVAISGTLFPLKGVTSNAPILVNNAASGQECYQIDSASNSICRDSTSTGNMQFKTAGGTGFDFILGGTKQAGITAAGALYSLQHNACTANSGTPCNTTVTCSISAGTTCTVNATVPATSSCVATANSSDTTTGAEWIKMGVLSTNTQPVVFTVSASQTTTAAANVNCL